MSVYSASEKQNKINYTLIWNLFLQGEDFTVDSFSISKNIATDTIADTIEKNKIANRGWRKIYTKNKCNR